MSFRIAPFISILDTFDEFLEQYQLTNKDLIITNEYILQPNIEGKSLECDVLYQEQYGKGEPTDEMVDAMLEAIDEKGYERIIAIGGGTVIDISKLFVFGDGLNCEEIYAKGATLPKKSELIAIPTTCGTGSEVTNVSIIQFIKKNTKLGLAIPQLFPDEAVLITSLLKTLPYEVFATSSIDALIHSVESYVSPKADPFTKAFSEPAVKKILGGYKKIVAEGKEIIAENIKDFLIASTFGGIAFGNAGCAAVHALSYPLGANFHIPHGKANYLVFSQVFEKYREKGADLSELEQLLCEALDVSKDAVWTELTNLLDKILSRSPLKEFGMKEEDINEFAVSVIENQQRLLVNNPIELTTGEIADIYKQCF